MTPRHPHAPGRAGKHKKRQTLRRSHHPASGQGAARRHPKKLKRPQPAAATLPPVPLTPALPPSPAQQLLPAPALQRPPSHRHLAVLLLAVGLGNGLLWLDSLDRYLGARYHLSVVGEWLPAPLAWPSQALQAWMQPARRGTVATASSPVSAAASVASAPAARPTMPPIPDPMPPGEFVPSVQQQQLPPGPQRILFAGDSMMQGVAPLVIRELSRQHPDWQLRDESRQSTGLTVKRYFDWPGRIIEAMDEQQLTLVVVFLGPNDPWDIHEPGRHLIFPSPEWQERYASRVDEILLAAKARGVRVLWIGLPTMREGRVHNGAVVQNRIFYQRAWQHGTDYLSTEALVGPLSAPFQKHQPQANGSPVLLRADDGIHFAPAGLQRVKQAVLEHLARSLPEETVTAPVGASGPTP